MIDRPQRNTWPATNRTGSAPVKGGNLSGRRWHRRLERAARATPFGGTPSQKGAKYARDGVVSRSRAGPSERSVRAGAAERAGRGRRAATGKAERIARTVTSASGRSVPTWPSATACRRAMRSHSDRLSAPGMPSAARRYARTCRANERMRHAALDVAPVRRSRRSPCIEMLCMNLCHVSGLPNRL